MPQKRTTTRTKASVTTARAAKTVYIYHDSDHGDIEVFDDFEKAVAHLTEQWGEPDFDPQLDESGEPYEWHDNNSDYASIYKREVK